MASLPVQPPVAPMLARLARELPTGPGWSYEPKWDGFRCLVFRAGDEVDLRSRNDRPLARYFPEVVEAVRALPADAVVLDGELLVTRDGRADFPALMARVHPAPSRVALLRAQIPARLVAFDLLGCGEEDLRAVPFGQRRARLEQLLAGASIDPAAVELTPTTTDPALAQRWLDALVDGADGVVAKRLDGAYEPGRRVMVKVKRERTADCVVAGMRLFAEPLSVSSLLLGLYDDAGALHHVGVVTGISGARRVRLLGELAPLAAPLAGHPWQHGFVLGGGSLGRLKGTAGRWTPDQPRDWEPLRPELVCEVAYDAVEGLRFRHPARFRRWRPDRDPRSCTVEQLQKWR